MLSTELKIKYTVDAIRKVSLRHTTIYWQWGMNVTNVSNEEDIQVVVSLLGISGKLNIQHFYTTM